MDVKIEMTVNGKRVEVRSDPDTPLLEVLREDLELTGTKYGCGEGSCGACTVLLDGESVRSCITPVSKAAGREVRTIEGLAAGGKLHPVQEAFLAEGAMQCGYCTSGMIIEAVALVERNPSPTDAQIVEAMNGHLCRCCGYPKILRAVRRAGAAKQGGAR
ncbi:MAG: (2Fe-2S)-binding protein [Phycisphaerae bacterium]|nr:(2Fe-2S)-binding protein [Phycisphaerae bacterium]